MIETMSAMKNGQGAQEQNLDRSNLSLKKESKPNSGRGRDREKEV